MADKKIKDKELSYEELVAKRDKLKKDGIALFKGSSGGVWLEEAIKINLHTAVDENKLVRQTPEWIARKNAFFSRFSD